MDCNGNVGSPISPMKNNVASKITKSKNSLMKILTEESKPTGL